MATINITGTGGIIEGNLGAANVNVNLDPIYGNFNSDTSSSVSNDNDFDDMWANNGGLFSAWIYPKSDGEGNFGRIADKNQWYMNLRDESSGFVRLNFVHDFSTTNGSWKTTDRVIPLNAWSHIALFYDSDSTSNDPVLYINGVAQTITEGTTPVGTRSSDASSDLYIGNNSSGTRGFDGYMMDIKIYKNTAWTQPEVAVLASKINVDKDHPGLPAPGPRLYLWWKAIADATTDSSGSGNNLTASNMGSVVYDEFSVDVYDNSTTTDGTFTVTQGKVECKALSSVLLDGESDLVTCTSNTFYNSKTAFSVSAWIRPHANNISFQTVVNARDSGNDGMALSVLNQTVRLRIGDGGSDDLVTGNVITSADRWYHLVATRDASNNTAIYVDGVLSTTGSSSKTISVSSGNFGIGGRPSAPDADEFDGNIRNVGCWSYDLSAEQVASLYSNTYPQTPSHQYKLDEGTGATANDTGTETAANGSLLGNASLGGAAHTQTLDLDYDLVIAANGTFSAPRGTVTLVRNLQNSGTFTHNGGTFEAVSGDNTLINTTGTAAVTFHNLLCSGGTLVNIYTDTTVENELHIDSSTTFKMHCSARAVTLTMGTTSSAGEIHQDGGGFHFDSNTSNAAKIVAADTSGLNPWFNVAGYNIDWDSGGSGSNVEIANGNYNGDTTTGGGGVTVKLTGDMEFDTFTVSAGDKLDLNGQRAEFSGNLSNQSTGSGNGVDYDGMLYFTGSGRMDSDGASENLDLLTLVQQGTSTSDADFAGDNLIKTFFYNQPSVTQKNHRGAIQTIIGSGTATCGTSNSPDYTNLTVATGGTLDGSSSTLTVAGDFTTSGGLLGASCLELNGSDEFAAQTSATTWGINSAYTIEMWLKTSTDSNMTLFDMDNGSDNANRIEIACNASTNEIKLTAFASDGTETALFTGNVFGQDFHDGKWHHLAVTNSGSEIKIYADGKLNKQLTATVSRSSDPSMRLFIGKKKNDSQFFDGEIEEVRIFTDVRTEAEIRADMFQGGTLANSGNLSARYSFDEGSGTAVDNSETTAARDLVASGTGVWAGSGTFTHGTSTLKMIGSSKNINYTGDETIGHLHIDAGQTTLNNLSVSDGTDTFTCSSLLIDSGTTFTTTSGTTTITGIESGASRSVLNNGTLIHNSGTFLFNGDMDQKISTNSTGRFNNITLNKSNNDFVFIDSSTTVEGNLDITMGDNTRQCRPSSTSGTITVLGNVIVREGVMLRAANDCSGNMEFGGLILESGGIYGTTSGTTKINGALRNIGGTIN